MKPNFFMLILLLYACNGKKTPDTQNPSVASRDSALFEILRTKSSDESKLVEAAEKLDTIISEPASFWSTIASDTSYPDFQRSICVKMLFKRHVHEGMKLTEVPAITGNLNWLKEGDISIPRLSGGSWNYAVDSERKKTYYRFHILQTGSDSPDYPVNGRSNADFDLVLSERIGIDNLFSFLVKHQTDSLISETIITAVK